MAKCGYVVTTAGAVALSASTAKSVLGIKSNSAFGLDLKKIRVSFDGVTASAVPAFLELCSATFATNAPGTASTSQTPVQAYGRVITHGVTAASAWTSEPTVLTTIDSWDMTPNGGSLFYDLPLGDTIDFDLSTGPVLRITATATVNCRASLWWERC